MTVILARDSVAAGYLSAEQEKTLKAALDGMLEHKNISTVARRLAEQLLKL